jgi:hypothetical protein
MVNHSKINQKNCPLGFWRKPLVFSSTFLGLLSLSIALNSPARSADTCTPISLVGGQGSEVTKTVSPPTVPGPLGIKITRNNWNTDWAVPGGRRFRRFVATVSSPDGGSFDIRLFLKYSDQTADELFNTDSLRIEPGKPLTIEAMVREQDQPYQVNLFANGINHIGNTYTASVVGCY